MRFMEANTFLKRAQSALLFIAIAKLNSQDGAQTTMSSEYLKKIE
jgi:hypothetical protein